MSQTLTAVHLHIIYSTKARQPLITPDLAPRLHSYLGGIIRELECVPLAIGGTDDHVHQLITVSPKIAVSDFMRVVKANSSRWVHELGNQHTDFAWQAGYGAFSVSESSVGSVRAYISEQAEHHRVLSFQDEFLEFLKRHRVDYDPRYIWE